MLFLPRGLSSTRCTCRTSWSRAFADSLRLQAYGMRDDEFLALQAAKREKKLAKKRKAGEGDSTPQKDSGAATSAVDVGAAESAPTPKAAAASAPAVDKVPDASVDDEPPLADEVRWCLDCSAEFTYTVGEQSWFLSKGFTGGKTRCAECTAAKKARFGETSGKGSAAQERAAKTTCYTCGQIGHKTKDCKAATCYNCGKPGHQSKDCKEARLNQAGGGVCFKFQTGSCTRGDTCRFAHVLESAATTATGW